MRVIRCTYHTDFMHSNSGLATAEQPLWLLYEEHKSADGGRLVYGAKVISCPRRPALRAATVNEYDTFHYVDDINQWPGEVCAYFAKEALLGENADG